MLQCPTDKPSLFTSVPKREHPKVKTALPSGLRRPQQSDRVPSEFITQGELKSHGIQLFNKNHLPQPNDLSPVAYWTSPERLIYASQRLPYCGATTVANSRACSGARSRSVAQVLFQLTALGASVAWLPQLRQPISVSLSLHVHYVVKRAYTSRPSIGLSTQRKMASSLSRPGAICTFSAVSDRFRATSSLFRPPGAPPSNPPAFVPSGTRVN